MDVFKHFGFGNEQQNQIVSSHAQTRNLNEMRLEYTSDFDMILVQSKFADVNVLVGEHEAGYVSIHFFGETKILGVISMNAYIDQRMLVIKEEIEGVCEKSKLKIEIELPKTFISSLRILSENGDVTVSEGVNVKTLVVEKYNGDISTKATYKRAILSTKNGNVEHIVNAQSDIETKILTTRGTVCAQFLNIGKKDIVLDSRHGAVYDCHSAEENGYTAKGYITTKYGDVWVG